MSMGLTPLKSVRKKCLDCCCYQPSEVRLCGAVACPLWPYRFGKRPTAEDAEIHLQEAAARAEKNRLMRGRIQG